MNKNKISEKKKINLMVIDDEQTCLISVMMMLYNSNINLITEENSARALEYIKNHNEIDLILLDLMMPEMDGFQFLDALHEDPSCRHIPIILQTGVTNPQYVKKAMAKGVVGYLSKPFDKAQVLEAIHKALDK
jgi:response regulator RpfG family c-di-GMP phosphodiesterase